MEERRATGDKALRAPLEQMSGAENQQQLYKMIRKRKHRNMTVIIPVTHDPVFLVTEESRLTTFTLPQTAVGRGRAVFSLQFYVGDNPDTPLCVPVTIGG